MLFFRHAMRDASLLEGGQIADKKLFSPRRGENSPFRK